MKELFVRRRPNEVDRWVWPRVGELIDQAAVEGVGLTASQAYYMSGLLERMPYQMWRSSVQKGLLAGQVDWGLVADGEHDCCPMRAFDAPNELWVRSSKLVTWFMRYYRSKGIPVLVASEYFSPHACYHLANRWVGGLQGAKRGIVFVYDGGNPEMGRRILARVQRLVTLMLRTKIARAELNARADQDLWSPDGGLTVPEKGGAAVRKLARQCIRDAGELVSRQVSFTHVCPGVPWVRRMWPGSLEAAIDEAGVQRV